MAKADLAMSFWYIEGVRKERPGWAHLFKQDDNLFND